MIGDITKDIVLPRQGVTKAFKNSCWYIEEKNTLCKKCHIFYIKISRAKLTYFDILNVCSHAIHKCKTY